MRVKETILLISGLFSIMLRFYGVVCLFELGSTMHSSAQNFRTVLSTNP